MSIFFDEVNNENNLIYEDKEIHPYNYYQSRQNEMEALKDKANFQDSLLTGIQNSKLQYFLEEYQQKQRLIEEKFKEENRYLQPDQYDPIFDDQEANINIEQLNQQQQDEEERKRFYEEFILKPQQLQEEEEKQMICIFNTVETEKNKPETQYLIEMQKGWLQNINKEIKYMKRHTDKIKKQTQNSIECKNIKLIKKLATTINNSFRVYFDEIFDALMDEILTEEVYFLNELENKGNFDFSEFDQSLYQNLNQIDNNNNLKDENLEIEGEEGNIQQFKQQINRNQFKKQKQRNDSPIKEVKRLASQQKVPIDLIQAISTLDQYNDDIYYQDGDDEYC
ncbi:hypothetical protein PPERSA_06992 [Pseudocohnilembus persalinus]|uniref:Uncharacterized protein n=1 Tax=Pseudocohnilembus persalinus TaxID=266149 RepID=A0A0V0QYW0_PSEPJ|nr:hypothetical protein PPERSA_06992 [Pseudocohnilembus persalinus]|eukprot:KRX07377.1 hypothetical protein PPERSA_06992 [Pseudocohnilembus persalinus]